MSKKRCLGTCIEGQTVLFRLIFSFHGHCRLARARCGQHGVSAGCRDPSGHNGQPRSPAKGLRGPGTRRHRTGVQRVGRAVAWSAIVLSARRRRTRCPCVPSAALRFGGQSAVGPGALPSAPVSATHLPSGFCTSHTTFLGLNFNKRGLK